MFFYFIFPFVGILCLYSGYRTTKYLETIGEAWEKVEELIYDLSQTQLMIEKKNENRHHHRNNDNDDDEQE